MILKQGNLENIILNAVWNLEECGQEVIDVASVQLKINTGSQQWAYTTVKTVLDRLVEKDLITRIKQGKKYFYKSTVKREILGERAIKNLADQYYNGNIEDLMKAVEKVCCEAVVFAR